MKGFLFLFFLFFQPIVLLHRKMLNAQAWIGGDRLMSALGLATLSITIISLSLPASVTAFTTLDPFFSLSCHLVLSLFCHTFPKNPDLHLYFYYQFYLYQYIQFNSQLKET